MRTIYFKLCYSSMYTNFWDAPHATVGQISVNFIIFCIYLVRFMLEIVIEILQTKLLVTLEKWNKLKIYWFCLEFVRKEFQVWSILKFAIATWMSNKRQLVLNVIICPNVQVLLRWEGKSNYRTTCAREEGGKYWESKPKSRAPGVSSYVALTWPHFWSAVKM